VSGRGRFITFEGIDGAGKSTLLRALAAHLQGVGRDALATREPGGTQVGEAIRNLVLHQTMAAATETLLMFAARAQHVALVIAPALAAGRWVLCDRFTDATFAYQGGGRGQAPAAIEALERWVHPDLRPDLTVLVDIAPAVAAARVASKRSADRFEREASDFMQRVQAVYRQRAAAEPERFLVLDGAGAVADLSRAVIAACAKWI